MTTGQQHWEVYRKLECQAENGAPNEWTEDGQTTKYKKCFMRINLARFNELCSNWPP